MTETLDTIEETLSTIEDTLDILEKGPRQNKLLVGGLVVVSLAAGAAAGYFFAKKKYRALADQEVAQVKEHYSILNKVGEYGDLEALAARHQRVEQEQIIQDQGYLPYDKVDPTVVEETVVVDIKEVVTDDPDILAEQQAEFERAAEEKHEMVKNVFDSRDPDTYFDYEEELERRSNNPGKPYVITVDEFNEGEMEYEQTTLTYYEGDDVLSNERDEVVEDVENYVGNENLLRFGHGSKDRNVVYVRNERLELDFEILYSDGKYAEEVLGFIEHSDKSALRRFRNYD